MATIKEKYTPEAMREIANARREANSRYNSMAWDAYKYGVKKFGNKEFTTSDFASATGLTTAAVASTLSANPNVSKRTQEITKTYVALDENGEPNFMDTYKRKRKVTFWRFA